MYFFYFEGSTVKNHTKAYTLLYLFFSIFSAPIFAAEIGYVAKCINGEVSAVKMGSPKLRLLIGGLNPVSCDISDTLKINSSDPCIVEKKAKA